MPGFMPFSAVEKEKVVKGKKGKNKKANPFQKKKGGKKSFAELYGKK